MVVDPAPIMLNIFMEGLIIFVPAAVPSEHHKRETVCSVIGCKYQLVIYNVQGRQKIFDEPVPGLISFTIWVPAAVPSLLHNSDP